MAATFVPHPVPRPAWIGRLLSLTPHGGPELPVSDYERRSAHRARMSVRRYRCELERLAKTRPGAKGRDRIHAACPICDGVGMVVADVSSADERQCLTCGVRYVET